MATREDVLKELARRELDRRRGGTSVETFAPRGPQNIAELTRGVISRPTLVGVGGIAGTAAGGAAGVATGPGAPITSPALATAGGALGTAAGSLTYMIILPLLGLIEKTRPLPESIASAVTSTGPPKG